MAGENSKLLIVEKDRVFMDVAYQGCGSGCRYCYVPTAKENQALASYEDISQAISDLIRDDWIEDKIVSFCPNTEPFKSKESIERVLFAIKKLLGRHCYIQISTKEYMSNELLQKLDALAEKQNIFINISIPFLDSNEIEPGAGTVEQRAANLERIQKYQNLKCGLYIKPFTTNAMRNVDRYIELIRRSRPDYVCIGVCFEKDATVPCVTMYHEERAVPVLAKQISAIQTFAEKIQAAQPSKIVYSSVCAIEQMARQQCQLNLWKYAGNVCETCVLHKEM